MAERLKVEVALTARQNEALEALARSEGCDVEQLVSRSVDLFVATYAGASHSSRLEQKIDRLHDHLIKLSVSLMKYTGQVLFYATLPYKTGPLKAKLNDEGFHEYWMKSERFAIELMTPPEALESAKGADKKSQ